MGDVIKIDNRGREIKYAVINATGTNNDTTIVPAVAAKIRVVSVFMVGTAGTAGTYTFQSGASGTALTGAMPGLLTVTMAYSPGGWFETAASTLLNMHIGGTGTAVGMLSYI